MPIIDPGRVVVQQMIDEASRGEQFSAVPVEGGTVHLPSTGRNLTIRLRSTSDLNQVVLRVPDENSSLIGQRLFIRSDSAIGELSVTGASDVTVDNWIVNLSPGDCAVFYKFDQNIWSKVSK
jgi:hypothetical protein